MITVECHSELSDIVELRSEWNRFAGDNVMRSFEWQYAWLESLGVKYRPRVLSARRKGQVVGILPLIESYRTWTGRTLELIGSGKACSDDIGIMCSDADAACVGKAFATWLLNTREPSWEHLDLDGVRSSGDAMKVFAEILMQRRAAVDQQTNLNCWAVAIPGNANTSIPWPRRFRKLTHRFQRESDQGLFRCEIASSFKQAEEFLTAIEAMHQARWQDQGIVGCFGTPSFRSFLDKVIHQLWSANGPTDPCAYTLPSNRVFISLLNWNDEPAAGEIAFRTGSTYAVYLTGMAPKFAEFRPGYKLHWFNANHANAIGCTTYDLLRGDEEYKQRMGGEPTPQERWLISAPKWNARLRKAIYQSARDLRDYLKPQPKAQSQEPVEAAADE